MKFPTELSAQRLSLLNEDDKALYDFEHSIYYSKELYEQGIRDYQECLANRQAYYMKKLNEDIEFSNLETSEKIQMAENLTKVEADYILNELINIMSDILPEEDIKEISEECYNNLIAKSGEIDNELLEAAGHDMTYWLQNMGWFGKIIGGLLTGLLGGLIAAIMAGKDKWAQKMLEKYMNKLVELIDDGRNKKKSFFSWFGFKRENTGDQSQVCFRSIQENIERNRLTYGSIFCKSAGLFGTNAINDAMSGSGTTGGGYYSGFEEKIAQKIKELHNENKD